MKVTTKDFQILKGEHTFEFPVGITVIQGKTGSGKTTVFYAVEDCLTNPSGVDDAIHWDCKQASVTIENNNNKITWIKTQTSSEYTNELTGQKYVKASKIDSTDLGDLGFYIDPSGDVVNIHSEWKKLFPFDLKDTEMFRLFEDIFNISCSFALIDDYKKDEQGIKSQINQTTSQINALTQEKTKIDDILNKVDLNTIQTLTQTLNTKQNIVSQMVGDYTNLSENYKYKKINIPPAYDTTSLINKSTYCNSIKQDYNKYQVNYNLKNIVLPEIKTFNIQENKYKEDFNKYMSLQLTKQQNEQQLALLDTQLAQLMEQKKQIKVCPTCGHSLDS